MGGSKPSGCCRNATQRQPPKSSPTTNFSNTIDEKDLLTVRDETIRANRAKHDVTVMENTGVY